MLATLCALLLLSVFAFPVTGEEPDCIKQAVTLLRSRYLSDREQGRRILEELPERNIPVLQRMLKDNDSRVAYAAAKALAKRGIESSVEFLYSRAMQSPVEYAPEVLPLLSSLASKGYDDRLLALLYIEDDRVRSALSDAIRKFTADSEVSSRIVSALTRMLHSMQFEERMACEAGFCAVGERCLPVLLDALQSPFPIYNTAISALSGIGEAAVEPLWKIVRSEHPDGMLLLRASMALSQISSPKAFNAIKWMLRKSGHRFIRIQAANALSRFPELCSADLLILTLNDPVADVRVAALNAISRFDKLPDGFPLSLIVSRLGDVSPAVRGAAVTAASKHKLAEAVPLWQSLCYDGSSKVILNALWNAGTFPDKGAEPVLLGYLRHEKRIFRLPAAKSLLQLGRNEGEAVIINALMEREEVRKYALYALSFASSRNAVKAIVDILPGLNPEYVRIAQYSLYSITGAIIEPSLWPAWWKEHGDFWQPLQKRGVTAYCRGRMYERAMLFHFAEEYYRKAARLAPSFPFAHYCLARMLLQKGDKPSCFEAITEAEKSLSLLPDGKGYLLIARAYEAVSKYEDALQAIRNGIIAGGDAVTELKELQKRILKKVHR